MKEEIVKEFLSRGKLLTPDALELLSKGSAIKEQEGAIVTEHDVRSPKTENYKIIKNLTSKKREFTTADITKFYRDKYTRIRDIIVNRLQKNFISLNKLDNYRNEIYVVGIVRDVREKDGKIIVELEDQTAAVPIIFDRDDVSGIEADDVVAAKAISAKNVLFGKQIIFPDIPLRQPATGYGKGCFVSSLHLDEAPKQDAERFFSWFEGEAINFLFVAGGIGDKSNFEKYVERYCKNKTVFVVPGKKDSGDDYPQLPIDFGGKIVSLSNPAAVEINGLKVLLINEFNTDFLKKRYLGSGKIILGDNYLVLDDVPDVVCTDNTQNPHVLNYKSVTIVNSGSLLADFRPVVIDFATRDTNQVKL